MFGGIEPANFYQDYKTGENNLQSAIAAKFMLFTTGNHGEQNEWRDKVVSYIKEFSKESKYIYIDYEMSSEFFGELNEALAKDTDLLVLVVITVFAYGIMFIGACSPIHCRTLLTIFGLLTVFVSVYAGFGLSFMLGYIKETTHEMLYVLLMGVGIDDMFVVCNALDQVPLHLPTE